MTASAAERADEPRDAIAFVGVIAAHIVSWSWSPTSPGERQCPADALSLRLRTVLASASELPLDTTAHAVQVALTPIFLLSGIGLLMGLFNTRLADVSAHIAHTTELLAADVEGEGIASAARYISRGSGGASSRSIRQ